MVAVNADKEKRGKITADLLATASVARLCYPALGTCPDLDHFHGKDARHDGGTFGYTL